MTGCEHERERIELPPPLPPNQTKSGVCFEVSNPKDDRDRTRVTVHQPTNDRFTTDTVIDISTPTARSFDAPLPAGPWPGSGERYDTCGEDFPAAYCPGRGCGKIHHWGQTCHRSRCPRCWRSWCLRRTKPALANISACARVWQTKYPKVFRHHLTVSFANRAVRFDSADPLGQAFEAVKRLLTVMNVTAGFAVYHPFRITHEHRGDVLGHSSGAGDMTPADILTMLSEGRPWDEIAAEYLSYAPHFHVVGVSEFAMTEDLTGPIEKQTGIVAHRITGPDGKSIAEGEVPTAAVLAYTLSHAGLIEDASGRFRPPIRAFGPIEAFDTAPVKDAITAAVRKVSHRVVGLSLPSGTCSALATADGTPQDYTPGSLAGQFAVAEAMDPDSDNPDLAECGTDLVQIGSGARVARHLADREWRESLPAHRREALEDVCDNPPGDNLVSEALRLAVAGD